MTKDLQQQMSDYLEGRMTAQEKQSFENALKSDPELEEELNELLMLEEGLNALGMENFMEDLRSWEKELVSARQQLFPWKKLMAVAAVMLAIAVPAIYLLTGESRSSEELFMAYYEPYEEMIISRGDGSDSVKLLLVRGMEAYTEGAYDKCSELLQSYLRYQQDARVSLYLAIAQLELDQKQSAEENFMLAQKDPIFRQQAQWYQALSYLKFSEVEKAKDLLALIVEQKNHYRNSEAGRLLKELS